MPWPPLPGSWQLGHDYSTPRVERLQGCTGAPANVVQYLSGLRGKCLDQCTALGGCVAAELTAALSKVAVQGCSDKLKVECRPAPAYNSYYPLWTITW